MPFDPPLKICGPRPLQPVETARDGSRHAIFPPAGGLASLMLFILLGVSGVTAQGLPGKGHFPDSAEVAGIISFLAGDELQGRGSFSSGNDKAARFIAEAFRRRGLVPLDGEDSIMVRFPVNRRRPLRVRATLNGVEIPDTSIAVSTRQSSVNFRAADSLPVYRMGETFDRSLMRKMNGLLLVPRSLGATFGRYRRYMAEPRVFMGEPEPGVLAAVLTDDDTVESFTLSYSATADTPTLVNVVGVLPGKRPAEFVLFSAHYDHLGVVSPVGGDSIANGANDDASGTTALIALASYFASRGTPERTLIFAAFAGEEIGAFGSRILAERLNPGEIIAMVNLEMVGTVSKFGPNSFWITGYERSDLGPMVAGELEGTGYSVHPDPYPDENLFFRSDNASFAKKGVPAHSFSTDPIDVDTVYHTVDDEIERLDIGHLTRIIRGIALGVEGLVGGRQTPARIKIGDK